MFVEVVGRSALPTQLDRIIGPECNHPAPRSTCAGGALVVGLLAAGMLMALVGDIYSEKVTLNGFLLILAGLLSTGAAANWGVLGGEFADLGVELQFGLGFKCLIAGCVMALLGGITCYLDTCVCIDQDRRDLLKERSWTDCDGDGVGFSGRFGALLSVCTWGLLLSVGNLFPLGFPLLFGVLVCFFEGGRGGLLRFSA
jgi:hypothetical protein